MFVVALLRYWCTQRRARPLKGRTVVILVPVPAESCSITNSNPRTSPGRPLMGCLSPSGTSGCLMQMARYTRSCVCHALCPGRRPCPCPRLSPCQSCAPGPCPGRLPLPAESSLLVHKPPWDVSIHPSDVWLVFCIFGCPQGSRVLPFLWGSARRGLAESCGPAV